MTPIEKNVIVVDELGNEYGATYPKRARGLVKIGRARFIDENRICLACPPHTNEFTEDIKMSENTKATENLDVTETAEIAEDTTTKYTLNYVLEQIERIQADTEHIKSTVIGLSQNIQDPSGFRSLALGDAVKSRETTNQRLIAFYEKMYDDLKPKAAEPIDPVLKTFIDMLELDKAIIRPEYRERIMQQMVEYAEQLKAKAIHICKEEEKQSKDERIAMLLESLTKCTNDSAACYIGTELASLMND